MFILLGIVKTLFLWGQVLTYIVHQSIGALLIRDPDRRLRFHAYVTHRYARFSMWFLGFRVTVKGREHIPDDHRVLLASNHLSYLDIIVMSSVIPLHFITSVEVRDTFFLGFMSGLGGSLFVERRSKSRLLEEIGRISATIDGGHAVVLFPEGTTSNGDGVLPFRMALFAVAERSGFTVSPMCICYQRIGGQPVTAVNRDRLYYYGGIEFFPHLLQLPFVKPVDVTLEFLPPFPPGSARSRKELAEWCFNRVSAAHARLKAEAG